MNKKFKWIGLMAAVLTLSLLVTGTAFAEGEEPPAPTEPAAVEEAAPPPEPAAEAEVEVPAPVEEAPVEEPAPVEDTAPADGAVPGEPAPVEEPAPIVEEPAPTEGVTPEEALPAEPLPLEELVPEKPEVVLVDADGEVLDGASQESATKLSGADPRWQVGAQWYSVVSDAGDCYAGTIPGSTCFVYAGSDLITYALGQLGTTGLPTDRKMYVESGDYTENIYISPTLSLLNGLIGLDGSGTTTINGDVTIENNTLGFTLQGFTINGGILVLNSSGALLLKDIQVNDGNPSVYAGIEVYGEDTVTFNLKPHAGTVTLEDVNANYSSQAGGAFIYAGSTVTIKNSGFNDNELWQGLAINSNGAISIEGVTANHNNGDGISIGSWGLNYTSLTIKNTTASNNNCPYEDWSGYGIYITQYSSSPSVTLENVTTSGNSNDGIYIYTKGVVTAKNVHSEFNDSRYGFLGYYDGSAYVYEKVVQDYLADDVDYDEWKFGVNESGGKTVDISLGSLLFSPILKLGYYTGAVFNVITEIDDNYGDNAISLTPFLAQGDYFIRVYAHDGEPGSAYFINLDCVDCETDRWLYFDGASGFRMYSGTLKMSDSEFNNNAGNGVTFNGYPGTATITSTLSRDNGRNGFLINAPIAILNAVISNNNLNNGIDMMTSGAITMTSIKACDNYLNGVWLEAWMGTVAITNGVASDNNNGGFFITSRGATLRNIVANNNHGSDGVYLYLKSGSALMEHITANDNGGGGVYIEHAVNIVTPITLRYMTAHGNANSGIYVDTLGAVTVLNSFTNNNSGNGLYITTKGAVLLTTIRASWNGYNGLKVEGSYVYGDVNGSWEPIGYLSPTMVTLNSPADPNFANAFDSNGWQNDWDEGMHGVSVISEKPVTIQNFSASDNDGDGVHIDKPAYWIWNARKPVYGWLDPAETIWGIVKYGDYEDEKGSRNLGAALITTTIPSWRNYAGGNMVGVVVWSAGAVTINGLDTNENMYHSIEVITLGAITLANVSDFRTGEGNTVYLDNMGAAGFMPVTITNLEVRETQGEWGAALAVQSKGAITITNLWLEDNKCMGAALANAMDGRGNVTVTNATIQNNNWGSALDTIILGGIQVISNGAVAFTNVRVNDNFGDGATIDNIAPYPLVMAVTLTDCEFNNNHGSGLQVYSKGLITLKGVEVQWSYIRYGYMDFEQTVLENNQPEPDWGGVDQWSFYYEDSDPDPVVISLYGFEFDAVATLLDENGIEKTPDDTSFVDGVWTSTFDYGTLATYATYTVLVNFVDDVGSDGWGRYWLSINDPGLANNFTPADGAVLNNTYGTTAGVTVLPTTLQPFNEFGGNNGYGLNILSNGVVAMTNLNAGDSAWQDGIHVETLGAVTVQSTVSNQPVGLNQNGGSGIYVRTNGLITLKHIQANNNGSSGADLDNALCQPYGMGDWNYCTGTGGVTLNAFSGRTNEFKNNGMFGVWINSRGAVLLTNIYAENNALDGAMVRNVRGYPVPAAPVTVTTLGAVYNGFYNNGWDWDLYQSLGGGYYEPKMNGLSVFSGGIITILNVNATGNDGGIVARNYWATAAKAVTITNAYAGYNRWVGIYVESNGAITLTNGYAWENGSGGTDSGGISLDNTYAPAALPVTLTDWDIQNNQGFGLNVLSNSLITLKGVTVQGSYIRNGWLEYAESGQTVYENNQPDWGEDTWSFYYGGYSTDPVTITLRGYGLYRPIAVLVDSNWTEITPDDTDFSDNVWTSTFDYGTLAADEEYQVLVWWDGMESNGSGTYSLSVNDVDEEHPWYQAYGAWLENMTGTTAGVTILPTAKHPFNEFSDNNSRGLTIFTNGPVIMTNLNAGRNTYGDGVHVEAGGAVSLMSTLADSPASLSENGWNGIYVRTKGPIMLKNIQANNNWNSGADLDNALCADYDDVTGTWYNCTGTGAITVGAISGRYNEFNNNGRFGLWAVSRGAITISNAQANQNGWDGAFLWNDGRGTVAPITVNTVGAVRNEFNDNARNTDGAVWFPDPIPAELAWMDPSDYYWSRFNGLTIMSGSAITILNTDVSDNQNGIGCGIVAFNDQSLIQAPVLISNTNAQENYGIGLYVGSKGAVTLTNVTAMENGEGGGISVDNAYCYYNNVLLKWVCPTPGAVTMTNITSENNGGPGLNVYSLGVVRLTTANISGNNTGIHIENGCTWNDDLNDWVCPTFTNSITLTGVNANNNQGTGVEAFSRGLIALTTVTANNNWNDGIVLNNKDYYDPYNTTLGITLSNVQAYNNAGTGISARTNGTLGMANIRAIDNVVRDGNIFEGQTVQDYVNEYKSGDRSDHWWFEATAGNPYELILQVDVWDNYYNRMAFDPWMELIDPDDPDGWDNPLLTIQSGDLGCIYNDSCTFTFDPDDYGFTDSKWFVVRVGSDYGDTSELGDGFYRLSLNDPDPDDEPDGWFWANGFFFEAGGNVTLTGINSFHGNSLVGFGGITPGSISLSGVGASDNGTEGIYVDNCNDTGSGCTGTGNILLAGSNIVRDNGWEGLIIYTKGTVGVSNLDASYNGYRDGGVPASVKIEASGVGKAVNLTNVNAQHNKGNGIELDVWGITTFNNVHAWLNGDWPTNSGGGVYMDSHHYAINLLNYCWFMNNADSGFAYDSYGSTVIVNRTNSVFWGNGGDDFGPFNR